MTARFTPPRLLGAMLIAAAPMMLGTPVLGQHANHFTMDLVGLEARLGPDTPTGAGIVVGQVEAANPGQPYGPDQSHVHLVGKNYFPMSGTPGSTSHATEVAKWGYGDPLSMAPDVSDIYLWGAASWLQSGALRVGQGSASPPLVPPGGMKLINHSWIGEFGSTALDNEALRRTDFMINRDSVLFTNGVPNVDDPQRPLMSHIYNGLSVGRSAGIHNFSNTGLAHEGAGRMKPEICAPAAFTSFATPQVNAAGSIMVETARTWPGLASNPDAERTDILKAVLLTGGQHDNQLDGTWSNEPMTGANRGMTVTPLDDRMGVGTVDVNRSHMILTALEQDGSLSVPATSNASWTGWDLADVAPDSSVFYRFQVSDVADEVSITITWNRYVNLLANQATIASLTLTLWRADGTALHSLVGNDGLPYFADGNVQSASPVDNVEHLYVQELEPGAYVLEVERTDTDTNPELRNVAVAWLFPEPTFDPEDVNQDGIVGFQDLLMVISAWGMCDGCPEDIDGDGMVGFTDLLAVISTWS